MSGKTRVVVLMGGASPEYDVSLSSGDQVIKNIDKSRFIAKKVVIPRKGENLKVTLDNLSDAEVVFITMHGPFGEDGRVQGMLELAGLAYTGPGVLASSIGMDKRLFKKLLAGQGIRVPKDITLKANAPCFVKPANQGSSIGASIVTNRKDLKKAIDEAQKYSKEVMIEEYLDGTEVTCAVLGNEEPQALPIVEIVPLVGNFFDYESKYTESGADEIVPARISKSLTKRVQEIAIQVYKLLGCRGFSRVDFILKDGRQPVVLEINTIPGLTSTSLLPKAAAAAGISYSQLITKIIDYARA